ncbi:TANK isoform 8 [Pan troglodytes]|uniref:TANK isoform 8 n=1 Tax=Pan troglodytes TaxID=9598 RepID=A0A2J8PQ36_PANTR|nr:TANK isoform 8 [Pan troglodytes]
MLLTSYNKGEMVVKEVKKRREIEGKENDLPPYRGWNTHPNERPVIYSILYSDATGRRGMDKNIGEQLNKAYEAFRQACMDRDSAVKELQQKTENYEQRIREQQEQLSLQQTIIDKLKSQLLLVNSTQDNNYGCVPLLEDSETRKNNLTVDQPQDKVISGIAREKLPKVRRQEVSSPRKETSARSLGSPLLHERGNIEKTFWDLKEEFHRICMLAKAQKDHLSKLNIPDTATAHLEALS